MSWKRCCKEKELGKVEEKGKEEGGKKKNSEDLF
jgi:hypothetical protein